MKILQLTDIHIGGEYGGKFKCRENFEYTLDTALENNPELDLIVITGDLADQDYAHNYAYIKNILDKIDVDYVVLPGNHDSLEYMVKVFGKHTVNPTTGHIENDGILFWDNCIQSYGNHPNFPKVKDVDIVFCHYPVVHIPHMFMKNYAIPKETSDSIIKDMETSGVKYVFCGHFHYGHKPNPSDKIGVFVAPATQCQLNPASKVCDPYDLNPGYAVITLINGRLWYESKTLEGMLDE